VKNFGDIMVKAPAVRRVKWAIACVAGLARFALRDFNCRNKTRRKKMSGTIIIYGKDA